MSPPRNQSCLQLRLSPGVGAGFLQRVLADDALVVKLEARPAGSAPMEAMLLLADEAGLNRKDLKALLTDCGGSCAEASKDMMEMHGLMARYVP